MVITKCPSLQLWVYLGFFIIAEVVLVFAHGSLAGDWGNYLLQALILVALCFCTARIAHAQMVPFAGHAIVFQFLAIVAIVVFTGIDGARFNGRLSSAYGVPIWDAAHASFISSLSEHLSSSWAQALANLAFYALPAVAIASICGASLPSLGLGAFVRSSWKLAAVWICPLLIIVIVTHLPFRALMGRIALNMFMNGLSEEILFRGVLLGRLQALVKTKWALCVQATLFGIWHLGLDLKVADGSAIQALALAFAAQGTLGYALGFLRERSGNVVLPALVHAWFDALS